MFRVTHNLINFSVYTYVFLALTAVVCVVTELKNRDYTVVYRTLLSMAAAVMCYIVIARSV